MVQINQHQQTINQLDQNAASQKQVICGLQQTVEEQHKGITGLQLRASKSEELKNEKEEQLAGARIELGKLQSTLAQQSE